MRTIAAALLLLACGVPILDTATALLLAAALLALVFGECRRDWRRLGAAACVVVVVVGCRTLLPRADLAEAHNAFLVIADGEPLQQGLPREVFESWKRQFDALYPPDSEPYEARSQWRRTGPPKTLFAASADAIWRRPKYTRQVDRIDFHSLGEFRGGFANEPQYNFWEGELRRESMPFYVMYELTPASAGSRLAWKGQLFWERSDGRFDEIVHQQVADREITPADAGKRVYAAFFPTPGPLLTRVGELSFRMEPSLRLRVSGWTDAALTMLGVIAVVILTVRPRWLDYLGALVIFSAGYALLAAFMWASVGRYLGGTYPPHGGGDDGMVHDGLGRIMAMLAARGDVVRALEGTEPVYWFTPGMRYERMVEKLIFGDTNHLYALLLASTPIVVFWLVRHFLGIRWAWVLAAVFLIVPLGNMSFLQYMTNAKLGYGEALACGLFLLGLLLMLRTQPAWGGTHRHLLVIGVAGAALAGSMFVRPNFAPPVVWLGGAYAWASLRRHDRPAILAVALGLMCALWMPFHNWYYGGEFHLIARSAGITLPLGPGDYGVAGLDLLRGRFGSETIAAVTAQITRWLWGPIFVVVGALAPVALAAKAINLAALVVTGWVALQWMVTRSVKHPGLAVVAMTALFAHAPMLFLFRADYRYAMLGRDLSLVVLAVWLVYQLQGQRAPAAERVSVQPAASPTAVPLTSR